MWIMCCCIADVSSCVADVNLKGMCCWDLNLLLDTLYISVFILSIRIIPSHCTSTSTFDIPSTQHLNNFINLSYAPSSKRLILFCICPPLCAGALWPMPAWVWRDVRSVYFLFSKLIKFFVNSREPDQSFTSC